MTVVCHFLGELLESNVARWTYVGELLKRLLFFSVGVRILPRAFQDCLIQLDVQTTTVTTLTKMVASDKDDNESQRKLRLLRICEA